MSAGIWTAVILAVGLLAVAVFGPGPRQSDFQVSASPKNAAPPASGAVIPDQILLRKEALKGVSLAKLKHKMTAGGRISEIDAVIKNESPYNVKDISIHCNYLGKSGTIIDKRSKTAYQILPTGKSISANGLVMGLVDDQVDTISCFVSDLKIQ